MPIKIIFQNNFQIKFLKNFISRMNKANQYKRKANSHNENIVSDVKSYLKQNDKSSFKFQEWHCLNEENCFSKKYYITGNTFAAQPRRFSTQNFQIEPFRQIQNVVNLNRSKKNELGSTYNLNNTNEKSFIKTKKAKLYPKSKISFRQNSSADQKSMHKETQTTNFQILKKQIQQLESQHILRGSHIDRSQHNPQMVNKQDQQKDCNQTWSQNKVFIVRGQFSSGKNISLLERQRQTIKKVLKNKKFRNYINPYRKADNVQKNQQHSSTRLNQRKSNLILNTDLSLFSSNQCFKKRETPHVVRRYYRLQTCSSKQSKSRNKNALERSVKLQLASYVSSNSLSKRQKQVINRTQMSQENYFINRNIQVTATTRNRNQKRSIKRHQISYQKSQSSKNDKNSKRKQLLVICI